MRRNKNIYELIRVQKFENMRSVLKLYSTKLYIFFSIEHKMWRSLLILSVLIASSCTVSGQYTTSRISTTTWRDNFEDFRGQKFCATRYGNGQCCSNRVDECSVPIAGEIIKFV